eukprot:gene7670-12690_t
MYIDHRQKVLQACLMLASASMSAACFCTGDYSPFCGPNGKTYSNLCNAICELGTGGIAGGYLGECGAKTTTKKGGTANDACAVNRVESSVSACSYGNGDSADCRVMSDGRHSLVAMRGFQIDCSKLPLTVELELDEEVHVETITLTSDWYAKRPQATTVNAMLHAEEEWHPVSFDNHDGFKGDEDYSCGDAITMFGGMKCCYPPDRCGGGKAGSFHNISVSVVTDKLQILIDRKDGGQRCNGGVMYLDEILIWGNKPKCMDRCEKDCSGTDRGTCTPFAIDGKLGNVLLEGPDEAQYGRGLLLTRYPHVLNDATTIHPVEPPACVCKPGYTGSDCSEKVGCKEEGFPFCEALGRTKMPSDTECKPDHEPESTKVYVAHNDKSGCGYGEEMYIDPCIDQSDIIKKVGAIGGASSGSDVSTLLSRNRGNLDAIMDAGLIINTKKDGCCPSNRLRLTETKVTSETCYTDFWAFQCMAACEDSCCATSTSTSLTSTTTSTTTMMDKSGYLELSSVEIEAIGKTIDDLLSEEVGFTPIELSNAGFSASDIAEAAGKAGSFTPLDLKAVPGMSVAKLEKNGFSANDVRSAGYSADAMTAAGYSAAEVEASKAFAPKEGSTTTTVIVVAAVLILAIVVAAVVVAKNRAVTGGGGGPPTSFENPMYSSSEVSYVDANPLYSDGQDTGGYMDVPAPLAHPQQTGYMDVSPGAAAQSSAGYMDVAGAGNGAAVEESDDEEV